MGTLARAREESLIQKIGGNLDGLLNFTRPRPDLHTETLARVVRLIRCMCYERVLRWMEVGHCHGGNTPLRSAPLNCLANFGSVLSFGIVSSQSWKSANSL